MVDLGGGLRLRSPLLSGVVDPLSVSAGSGVALYLFLPGGCERIGQSHMGHNFIVEMGKTTVEGAQQRSARGFCLDVS